jgi:serine/threonine-protein kinase
VRAEESIATIVRTLREAIDNGPKALGDVGRGGMARVDLIQDLALTRVVVRKRMHPELEGDPANLQMFIGEARIAGQLEHPNIVPVHELGLLEGRSPYFTMKRVEGRTLRQVIADLPEGRLSRDAQLDLLDVMLKVADALSFAHDQGVIHLDVKPDNVMVGDFGQVYLMDWGIARRATPDLDPNQVPTLIGTPTHMSSEQARGALSQFDPRTDVFGLGALLYNILSRRPPYEAENVWQLVVRAQSCEFPDLEEVAPGTPRELIRIVRRAMMCARDDRYPSVKAMRQDIVAYMRGGDHFDVTHVKAGEFVVRQGEEGRAAYVIESGLLGVLREEAGVTKHIREMGKGEVFGEMAILSPGPRTATVIAKEDSVLRLVTAADLQGEMDALKPWMRAFLSTLAARFREREESRAREG